MAPRRKTVVAHEEYEFEESNVVLSEEDVQRKGKKRTSVASTVPASKRSKKKAALGERDANM
jgi:hypothetical protein